MTKPPRLAALLGAATLASLAAGSTAGTTGTRSAATSPSGNWGTTVEARDNGHVIGNPDAASRLVEYMSYTCSTCAEFARTGESAIKLLVVPRGKVSFEIRHMLRDPIDLTATLLTHCGGPAKFLGNHDAVMARHGEWMERARAASQAQRTRWTFGANAARRRAIASDLGFYAIMEERGFNRPQIDRCLTDEAKAGSLAETSQRDVAALQLPGTPSFVLDGRLLQGVHNWDSLRPVIERLD
ncbi:MAG: thioredoxin domain-containing protein [Altererythrobacter sp.]|nr:thioredoxin domain-containing protein [Altererythrobacter sp.]